MIRKIILFFFSRTEPLPISSRPAIAVSIADTTDYGILRIIVNKPDEAIIALKSNGITVSLTTVIAIAIDDQPGGLYSAVKILSDNDISVEYMYACVGRLSGKALMVIRTDDPKKATAILHDAGYGDINPAEIYRI